MTKQSNLKRKISHRIEEISGYKDKQPAWVGKSATEIETGTPGLIHVRLISGKPEVAINTIAPLQFDYPVWVAKSKVQKSLWEVIGLMQPFVSPVSQSVRYHHEQHEYPAPDTIMVRQDQIMTMLVLPVSGLEVNLYGAVIKQDNDHKPVINQSLNLSSYVPSAGAVWAKLCVVDGAIEVFLSDEYESRTSLTPDLIPIGSGFDVCAIRLYSGQSKITRDFTIENDFIDLRFSSIDKEAFYVHVERLGSAVRNDLQYIHDLTKGAGHLSGGEITDAGSAEIDISSGVGLIRASEDDESTLYPFTWPETLGLAIPTDTLRFVVVEYNSGSPQVVLYSTETYEYKTAFPIGFVINEGDVLYINNTPHNAGRSSGRLVRKDYEVNGRERANLTGGLYLANTGTRNLAISEGATWFRGIRSAFAAFDTSISDEFDAYYRDGVGSWTKIASLTQWDNANYDDGSGTLASMITNSYTSLWFYLSPDNSIIMVYGQVNDNTLNNVLNGQPPSTLPLRLDHGSMLLGRFVIQEGEDDPIEVQNSFDFPPGQFLSSGGGAVESVNGQTGVVVIDYSDVGADPAGSASAAETSAKSYADGLVVGVEVTSNKTSTISGNELSTTLYSTIKGIVDWIKQGLTSSLSSKTTPIDADSVLINDSADSNKTKLTTWANIKATLKTYFDTLYISLIYTPITVTTTNVSASKGITYAATIAGLTANRDFNLPTPAAAGERIGLWILDGDADFALVIKANSVEITRLFIAQEYMTFVSTGTGAGDWKKEIDGRIPQAARIEDTDSQTISNNALVTLTLNELVFDNSNIADTTNYRIKARRTGRYILHGGGRLTTLTATATGFIGFFLNQSSVRLALDERQGISGRLPGCAMSTTTTLNAGDWVEFDLYQNSGSNQSTFVANDNRQYLSLIEVLT